jgi:hypothetical protein
MMSLTSLFTITQHMVGDGDRTSCLSNIIRWKLDQWKLPFPTHPPVCQSTSTAKSTLLGHNTTSQQPLDISPTMTHCHYIVYIFGKTSSLVRFVERAVANGGVTTGRMKIEVFLHTQVSPWDQWTSPHMRWIGRVRISGTLRAIRRARKPEYIHREGGARWAVWAVRDGG